MSSLLLFHQKTHWSNDVGVFFFGGPWPGSVGVVVGGGCVGMLGVVVGGGGVEGSLGVVVGGCVVGGAAGGGVGSVGSRRPGGTEPPGPRNCPPCANAAGARKTAATRAAARPKRMRF